MSSASEFAAGNYVRARGRSWVVLPESTPEVLKLRPLGGMDEEITGILSAIEPVESTTFAYPTAEDVGDFASGQLLRDAARLSQRRSVGNTARATALVASPASSRYASVMPQRYRGGE